MEEEERRRLDEDAERSLLGAILLKRGTLEDVPEVEPQHFGNWSFRLIFEAILRLDDDGTAIDSMTVAGAILSSDAVRQFADGSQVSLLIEECLKAVPHAEHGPHYARQVIEAAQRREAARLGEDLAKRCRSGADFTDLLDEVREKLNHIGQGYSGNRPELVVRCLADVEARPLEWLWLNRVPLGKLSLFSGDPGLGKSFVTCDITARVSRGGAWPDQLDEQPAGSVLILACEDDVEDTIRPRLDQAGADVAKVYFVEAVRRRNRERGFTLVDDVELLRAEVERLGDVRLLIIDPISAYCGSIDTHRNSEVRSLLRPLTDLAAKHRLAVIGINHLTKGTGKAVYRSTGSIAFTAAARAVWNFYQDSDDEDRRLMLPTKMNLTGEACGLAYRIEDGVVCWDEEPVYQTADDLQEEQAERTGSGNTGARQRAIDFLHLSLAEGPRPSVDLFELAQKNGISKRTLQRAFKDAGCDKQKDGMTGGWSWFLLQSG